MTNARTRADARMDARHGCKLYQCVGTRPVAVLGGVLVAQSSGRTRVTAPAHQVGDARTGGFPQLVPPGGEDLRRPATLVT